MQSTPPLSPAHTAPPSTAAPPAATKGGSRSARRLLIAVATIAASGVMLYLAFRDVDLARVGEQLARAEIGWVMLSVLGVIGAFSTRVVRWRGLLENRLSFFSAYHIFNIATAINQLPLRAGEVARGVMASRPGGRGSSEGVPVVTALTSVFIERLLDLLAVVILIAFSLSQLPDVPESVGTSARSVGLLTLIAFAGLLLLARFPTFADRLLLALERAIPLLARLHLRRRFDEVLAGIRPITTPARAAHALIWTVIAWTFSIATFYALTRAFNLGDLFSLSNGELWLMSSLCVPLVAFSIALPISVAGVGAIQGAVILGSAALGLDRDSGLSLGIMFNAVTVLTYLAAGLIGLIALGVRLNDVLSSPAPEAATPVSPVTAGQ